VINLLKKSRISYWLCHGTLLGIIRDGNLIPWDHDIDIAVWYKKDIKKKLKKLMLKNNFKLKKKYFVEDDLLTFIKKGGREVDINFYQVKKKNFKEIAFINWFVPKNNICKLVDALSSAESYEGNLKFIIKNFKYFEFFFKKLKNFLIQKNYFYKNIGYTQPLDLLKKFEKLNFKNIEVVVPLKYKEYLNYIYGNNWRIPKKNYNWIKDSPSTEDI
jgi:phosphorylcholine metabolism protein LicD